MHRVPLILLVFLFPIMLFAQADTIAPKRPLFKKVIFPSSLILAGGLLSSKTLERNIQEQIFKQTDGAHVSSIDEFLPFVPVAELYLADILGIKAKNHWFDQSKNLFMSVALNELLTTGLKHGINKQRPNGAQLALPSRHTSVAFTTATVLYEEFNETNKLLAYSGFGFAATTGVFRALNNEHWVSDILVGAGIGILSAKFIYHLEPLKNWNLFRQRKNMVLLPTINKHHFGIQSYVLF